MKRIAVLTSGGDAPGMNTAIRAVVRSAAGEGWETLGVEDGFDGLLTDQMRPLGIRDVGDILQRGGTILGSARSDRFKTDEGQRDAIATLERRGIEALAVIGGNGSQMGSYALSQLGFPVVGISSTIDNDLEGTEITIGVDTALNIALESIDRLRTTASSHNRAFLVEVMGRKCGYLALMCGIAGGAEAIVIPEAEIEPEDVAATILAAVARGKSHALVVVAEGAQNNAAVLTPYLRAKRNRLGVDVRTTILGHVQRGGSPTAFDRLLATRLGVGAVWHLARGLTGVLIGTRAGEVTGTPLADIVGRQKPVDLRMVQLAADLAR